MSEKAEPTLTGAFWNGVKRAANEIGQEMKYKLEQGAHEAAAGLFQGNAFVMYPRNQVEQKQENQVEQQEQSHSKGR